jgi:hypothetical protein
MASTLDPGKERGSWQLGKEQAQKRDEWSHSTLMFAALMMGHHFSISAVW